MLQKCLSSLLLVVLTATQVIAGTPSWMVTNIFTIYLEKENEHSSAPYVTVTNNGSKDSNTICLGNKGEIQGGVCRQTYNFDPSGQAGTPIYITWKTNANVEPQVISISVTDTTTHQNLCTYQLRFYSLFGGAGYFIKPIQFNDINNTCHWGKLDMQYSPEKDSHLPPVSISLTINLAD